MPAGTIALTNNSTTVGGTGTTFTSELKAGDFIGVTVGGAPYTMIVASIASNTQLTIAQPYNGPAASGLAWYGVPATLKYAIEQSVLNDMASNLRGMIAQMTNWQKIYSDAVSVTVERSDRSTFTGPSWGYMASQYASKADKTALDLYAKKGSNSDITSLSGLTTALSVAQGGTGGKNPADARAGLQLGTASTVNTTRSNLDPDPGRAMLVADFGLGTETPFAPVNANTLTVSGFYCGPGDSGINYFDSYSPLLHLSRGPANKGQLQIGAAGNLAVRGFFTSSSWSAWREVWSTRNTTVDTNNFIKKASPIARLTNNVSQMQPDFAVEGQHIIDGLVSVNDEAEGVGAEKVSTGIYRVTGSVGLSVEGWTIEGPQDNNGNRLCFIESEMDGDALIIRVSSRRFDINTAMIVANEPMDIPSGRWIDLRLQMPDDSAWNTRMREMEQVAEEE